MLAPNPCCLLLDVPIEPVYVDTIVKDNHSLGTYSLALSRVLPDLMRISYTACRDSPNDPKKDFVAPFLPIAKVSPGANDHANTCQLSSEYAQNIRGGEESVDNMEFPSTDNPAKSVHIEGHRGPPDRSLRKGEVIAGNFCRSCVPCPPKRTKSGLESNPVKMFDDLDQLALSPPVLSVQIIDHE